MTSKKEADKEPQPKADDKSNNPVVEFDLTVWMPHDVYGKIAHAFGGNGVTWLQNGPNS